MRRGGLRRPASPADPWLPPLARLTALAALAALGQTGCSKAQLVDVAMASAKRPATVARVAPGARVGGYLLLAGDMHCHVLPPDSPWHVTRELPETLDLVHREALDFVVLTPHVPRRFFMDAGMRAWVSRTQAELRARIAAASPDVLVVPGFEYTDFQQGHVGAAFADVDAVLAEVPVEDAVARPERFFERWVAQGGVLTINHPVEHPIPGAGFVQLRADLSWRGFSGAAVTREIAWVTKHAQSIETFNASIGHLRDQFILGDEDLSLRRAAALVDRTARAQHRRVAPVGGSDSHGSWLRATTYVLATERSQSAVRDAITEGRTCVRAPEACTFEAAAPGGAFVGVGGELVAPAEVVQVRARGGEVGYVVDGATVATGADGETISIPIPRDRCALVRAVVGRSWSAPIYVNCAWTSRAPVFEGARDRAR